MAGRPCRVGTRRFRSILITVCICGLAAALPPPAAWAGETGRGPHPAAEPVDDNGRMHISEGDRCPVCAMHVQAHRKFASAIQLMDGRTFYFCASGCMIRAWVHPEIFLNAPKADLKRSVVQDYFGGEHLDGASVLWVAGSDVVGPMGPALVPLKSEKELAAFKARHGAKTTFRLNEMNDAAWERITGKKSAPAAP
ncbi:MAG: nitrous oxide reductase accessory protein NosL [Desulfobacterales bacterium]|nr:nitrous oxide reductase accessory protein NosL [Desulfobacterales bacterium]